MKIYGFLQVRNEVSSGHLERFLKHNSELFDALYAIDDASEDGTQETLVAQGAIVLNNDNSLFKNENVNKSKLLERIALDAQDGDAILWLDADEVLYCDRHELEKLIVDAFNAGYDSVSLNHLNLWRSENYYRIDDQFYGLKPVRIWKFSESIRFPTAAGLHGQTHPKGLKATLHCTDFPVVHYGFASLDWILSKYASYDLLWQTGYPLDRLVNEDGLQLKSLSEYDGELGSKFSIDVEKAAPPTISPYEWKKMASAEKHRARSSQKAHTTIVCLIFKSVVWLEFAYGEALRLQREFKRGEVEILFVANDATQEVADFLVQNRIPHIHASGKKNTRRMVHKFGVPSL